MEFGLRDWVGTLIFAAIAVVFLVIYLLKAAGAKKALAAADDAAAAGDDAGAVELWKVALWKANEEPKMEDEILERLTGVYGKHDVEYSFEDFKSLQKQYRALAKKSSRKGLRHLVEVQDMKKKLIDRMPDL